MLGVLGTVLLLGCGRDTEIAEDPALSPEQPAQVIATEAAGDTAQCLQWARRTNGVRVLSRKQRFPVDTASLWLQTDAYYTTGQNNVQPNSCIWAAVTKNENYPYGYTPVDSVEVLIDIPDDQEQRVRNDETPTTGIETRPRLTRAGPHRYTVRAFQGDHVLGPLELAVPSDSAVPMDPQMRTEPQALEGTGSTP